MRSVLVVLCMAMLLCACDTNRIYETNLDLADRSWKSKDTTDFIFDIKDTSPQYNILFTVRNSLDYPYSRLFIRYILQDSTGKELDKKLVSGYLFDLKTGQPQGTSGLGDLYDHRFPLISNYAFRYPGKYKLRLQQYMRTDTLAGILAVGVRIEKSESTKP